MLSLAIVSKVDLWRNSLERGMASNTNKGHHYTQLQLEFLGQLHSLPHSRYFHYQLSKVIPSKENIQYSFLALVIPHH